ncbi:DNA ligase [Herminiimonas sp. CN]|uniref:DNA ligase n=1 Tax=Herminiimonas sp. CN TaxID=1349818 RepID=UPI00055560D9|nr:DNA ligase [Herminiimonas sp. CN]
MRRQPDVLAARPRHRLAGPAMKLPALRRLLALLVLGGVLQPGLPAYAARVDAAAPAVLLAQNFNDAIDPAAYLVSEKLDGVRALWDGHALRFRSGRVIAAPDWFVAGFPAHPLDGELWIGRRKFDLLSAAVRRQSPNDAEWRQISYQVFEWPQAPGTFSQRVAALQASVAQADLRWLQLVPQVQIADHQALQARLRQVVRAGGEGLMLHRADALWQTGRTDALLKLKPQHDAEATVVAHLPGQGKYQGMCGALLVESADGQRFRLATGMSDAQRRAPPPLGSTVTYRYRERTPNGLPRFASFLRVRASE